MVFLYASSRERLARGMRYTLAPRPHSSRRAVGVMLNVSVRAIHHGSALRRVPLTTQGRGQGFNPDRQLHSCVQWAGVGRGAGAGSSKTSKEVLAFIESRLRPSLRYELRMKGHHHRDPEPKETVGCVQVEICAGGGWDGRPPAGSATTSSDDSTSPRA